MTSPAEFATPDPYSIAILNGLQVKRAGDPKLHIPHAASGQPFVFYGVRYAHGGSESGSTKPVGLDTVIRRRAKNRVARASRKVNRQRG